MKIISRKTHNFIYLKVDEIETTIFKESEKEIKDTIDNLISIIEEIASLNGKTINDYIDKI